MKLLPFLFLTYLLMEWLEHRTGEGARRRIQTAGKVGPLWGGLLGVVPQCGFSAAAASLYAGRVITIGTLFAVFLSTSDEMLPILLSEAVPAATIGKILAAKVVIAVVSGFLLEFLCGALPKKKRGGMDIRAVCGEERCHCGDGILKSALRHTIKIFLSIFLIMFFLTLIMETVGEDSLALAFRGAPVVGELIAALIGLIPNCASSVVITQLYVSGVIGAGAMMAGLLTNAGVGLLVLFRVNRGANHGAEHNTNRGLRENLGIVAALYCAGVFWGVVIGLLGVTF